MKLKTAADLVEQKVAETLTYYAYPSTTGDRSARTLMRAPPVNRR
jgi:hypothetical protein